MLKGFATFVLGTFALAVVITGPADAQTVRAVDPPARPVARKDIHATNYWFSRDLSNVLTKVVTIKLR